MKLPVNEKNLKTMRSAIQLSFESGGKTMCTAVGSIYKAYSTNAKATLSESVKASHRAIINNCIILFRIASGLPKT